MRLRNGRLQENGDWCIPSAIEGILRHHGELGWDQRRIVAAWADWKRGPVSFDLGSPAQFLPATELGVRFSFQFRACSISEAKKILIDRSARKTPTIVSCAVPDAPGFAHMQIVTAVNADTITVFDPADACHREWQWTVLAPLLGDDARDVHMLLIDPVPLIGDSTSNDCSRSRSDRSPEG